MKDFSSYVWERLGSVFGCVRAARLASATAGGARPPGRDGRNPVLLIHGIHDSEVSMRILAQSLEVQGWEVHALSLIPSDGSLGLDELALQVAAFIDRTFPATQKIDLVGFSMGGLVCRYYIQCLNGARRVARFISISAPHRGSWLAYLSRKPGCVQMRPSSGFLKELDQTVKSLESVQFTSIWTPLDLMILPAGSSRIPIGRELRKWIILLPLMVLHHGCLRAVADILSEPVAGQEEDGPA